LDQIYMRYLCVGFGKTPSFLTDPNRQITQGDGEQNLANLPHAVIQRTLGQYRPICTKPATIGLNRSGAV